MLALALGTRDDVSQLLEKLRSDEFAEREAAQRSLERLGMPVLERLKAEAERETELDTKLRLKLLIERIPKLAQLAKVYGPTRRMSLSAKGERLGAVFEKITKGLAENVRGDRIDLDQPVTVELSEATLWEALDRLAQVTHTHYSYRQDGVVFLPGEVPPMPVQYYEQFRISVVEVKKIEYRSAGEKGSAVILVPEVRYQKELSPAGSKYRKVFTIDSIHGPDGADVRIESPTWAMTSLMGRRSFALEEVYVANSTAQTLSIIGKATVNFAQDSREVALALTGDPKFQETIDGTFRVSETTSDDGKTTVTLDIDITEAGGMDDRFRGVWLVDGLGKHHAGTILRMGREGKGKHFQPRIWFPVKADDAKGIVFRWMTGLHAVDIPFVLRDIKVP
jgi:hypothetical protein